MINIFLVEDQMLVRTGIKSLLNDIANIKVIGEASNGEEALKNIRLTKPDIVLMDIDLPGIGGLETARRLLRFNLDVKIIILTGCVNDIFPDRLLQMGVWGYVIKDAGLDELRETIHQVYKGKKYISPSIIMNLALKNTADNISSPLASLSDRELELIILIARGTKAQELAEKFHLSVKTINGYRTKIFKKLGVKNNVELTHLALQYGLIQSEVIE